MSAVDVGVFVVLFLVFALWIGACLLLMRASWRLMVGRRRPATGRPQQRRPPLRPPPDDWDDEEYIARHHH